MQSMHHLITFSYLIKKPKPLSPFSSLYASSPLQPPMLTCASLRTLRPLPLTYASTYTNNGTNQNRTTFSNSPRAMRSFVVSRCAKNGERPKPTWASVSSARFGGGTAASERGHGRNPADDVRSREFCNGKKRLEGDVEGEDEESSKALLTLPTILTIGRVAAVPLLVTTFYMNSWWATTATTTIFVLAAITDWLDGYLARKMKLGTTFGAFLDPVADKLMVAATLVLLCTKPLEIAVFGHVPWILTVPSIAIIGREITMSAVREWAASQSTKVLEAVAVNNLGKWKTATQMTALIILLTTRDSCLSGPGVLVTSGVALLYVSAGLTVWSLVVYIRKISRLLFK